MMLKLVVTKIGIRFYLFQRAKLEPNAALRAQADIHSGVAPQGQQLGWTFQAVYKECHFHLCAIANSRLTQICP